MSAQILLVADGGVADCMQTCKRCLTLYIQSKPIHCRKEAVFRGIYLTKNMSARKKKKPAALQNLRPSLSHFWPKNVHEIKAKSRHKLPKMKCEYHIAYMSG